MNAISTAEDRSLPPSVSEIPASGVASGTARARYRRTRLIVSTLVAAALASAAFGYLRGLGRESTDDAQVEGRLIEVAPRISGRVAKVLVADNQLVNPGDVLVELEHDDLDARLAEAKAELAAEQATEASARASERLTEAVVEAKNAEARSSLERATLAVKVERAGSERAAAGVASAEARYKYARQEWQRASTLADSDAVPQSTLDGNESALTEAAAALEQAKLAVAAGDTSVRASQASVGVARAQLSAANADLTRVEVARAAVALAEAHTARAEAARKLAELNRSYATIRAPVRGLVSQRSVEEGKLVGPERPLLTLVSPEDVWVVAAFKEDQIGHMRPGQPALIHVDAYSGRPLPAHVQSLAGASGARFAVLPPDNASGNFVKVVQRIPVLLRFDGTEGLALRPGMSVDVTVDTRAHP